MSVTRNEHQTGAKEKDGTCRVASQNAGFHIEGVQHRPKQIGSSSEERSRQQNYERWPSLMKCRRQPVSGEKPGRPRSQKPHADQASTDFLNRNSCPFRTQIIRCAKHGLYEAKCQSRDKQQPGCDLYCQSGHGGLTGIAQTADQHNGRRERQVRYESCCQQPRC